MRNCIFIVVMLLSLHGLSAQGLLDELQNLYMIDRLAEYRDDGLVEQFSSYDPSGKNDDGFSGKHSFIRIEDGNQVIAEMQGPGVINRIWTPTPSSDTIQFFFDGEKKPRISMPFDKLFTSDSFPFLGPVCGHEIGGYYCYLPIPYEESCKVVYKGKMRFYQLQYRTYPAKANICSFSMDWDENEKIALRTAVDIWSKSGTNCLEDIYEDFKIQSSEISISPGEIKDVFSHRGGGRIIGIEIEGLEKLHKQNNRLVFKAKWDNDENWAVSAPIKDLFGCFFGEKSMRSMLVGNSANVSYLYYPMPFRESASLVIEYLNEEGQEHSDLNLSVRIYYSNKALSKKEGKFYAHWRRHSNVPEGEPYIIMPKYSGKGHYVGTILNCQGLEPGHTYYFEGDDQATIDGELRLHGTGSEDYFNGGYYEIPDRWDMAHCLPSHGCLGYSSPQSRTGAYRHYFSDKLNFSKDFLLTIEHGGVGNTASVDYRSVAFYYADEGLPPERLTTDQVAFNGPETIIYRDFLFKILSLRNGNLLNGQSVDGKRVEIFELSDTRSSMLVKFELDVPIDGKYHMYCSYFLSPLSGEVKFQQRQVALTKWKIVRNSEDRYIEKELIGELKVVDGTCTVTVHLRGQEKDRFVLHQILLEKE